MADLITRMRLDSAEYDQKIKRAQQNLLAFEQQCRKNGQSMVSMKKENIEYVRALGQMETVSKTARGRLNELTSAFTELSVQYKRLTDEEKQSNFGKALSDSLGQLKTRIGEAKADLADVNRELSNPSGNQFANVLDTIGQKLGVTGNLTEMLTSKTALMTGAIGASVAAVMKATEAWAAYNSELAKQDQQTTVITGLKGEDANRMTDAARAMATVYNVDFRQAIDAANTIMTQFGVTGDEAIRLLREGMQGMIAGDGPKLLSMIQQFAPAFVDAGISADKLVAIIHNSDGCS